MVKVSSSETAKSPMATETLDSRALKLTTKAPVLTFSNGFRERDPNAPAPEPDTPKVRPPTRVIVAVTPPLLTDKVVRPEDVEELSKSKVTMAAGSEVEVETIAQSVRILRR